VALFAGYLSVDHS